MESNIVTERAMAVSLDRPSVELSELDRAHVGGNEWGVSCTLGVACCSSEPPVATLIRDAGSLGR